MQTGLPHFSLIISLHKQGMSWKGKQVELMMVEISFCPLPSGTINFIQIHSTTRRRPSRLRAPAGQADASQGRPRRLGRAARRAPREAAPPGGRGRTPTPAADGA